MKDIRKNQREAADRLRQELAATELAWARARRDVLLMRHPTNWAGASLLQVLCLGKCRALLDLRSYCPPPPTFAKDVANGKKTCILSIACPDSKQLVGGGSGRRMAFTFAPSRSRRYSY